MAAGGTGQTRASGKSVRMCVCVRSGRIPCHHTTAGGRSTMASLLPTKTLAIGGDTGTDHPSVPAQLV